jgi:hypothetical protein
MCHAGYEHNCYEVKTTEEEEFIRFTNLIQEDNEFIQALNKKDILYLNDSRLAKELQETENLLNTRSKNELRKSKAANFITALSEIIKIDFYILSQVKVCV